jgi:hypothetical protein
MNETMKTETPELKTEIECLRKMRDNKKERTNLSKQLMTTIDQIAEFIASTTEEGIVYEIEDFGKLAVQLDADNIPYLSYTDSKGNLYCFSEVDHNDSFYGYRIDVPSSRSYVQFANNLRTILNIISGFNVRQTIKVRRTLEDIHSQLDGFLEETK